MIERGDDEDAVDVCGYHLHAHHVASRRPREAAGARQHGLDHARAATVDGRKATQSPTAG